MPAPRITWSLRLICFTSKPGMCPSSSRRHDTLVPCKLSTTTPTATPACKERANSDLCGALAQDLTLTLRKAPQIACTGEEPAPGALIHQSFEPDRWAVTRPSQGRHDLPHEPRGLARRLADLHADLLERFLLRRRGARRPGNDRPRVAHRLALGSGEAGDVTHDRLGHIRFDESGGPLLGVPSDFTDHHDRVGLRICFEGA